MNEVDLGEFMSFCKDFSIPLLKAKLTEIFKKSSINHKPHKLEQFTSAIAKIGLELNKSKIDDASAKLGEVTKAIRDYERGKE
jgi:hypothetical protein